MAVVCAVAAVVGACSSTVAGAPVAAVGTVVAPTTTTTPTRITRTIVPPSTTAETPAPTGVLATTCEDFVALGESEQQRIAREIALELGRTDLADNPNFDLVARAGCLMHPTQLVKDTWAFD